MSGKARRVRQRFRAAKRMTFGRPKRLDVYILFHEGFNVSNHRRALRWDESRRGMWLRDLDQEMATVMGGQLIHKGGKP